MKHYKRGSVLIALCVIEFSLTSHVPMILSLSHFTDVETEAQKGWAPCQGHTGSKRQSLNSYTGSLAPESKFLTPKLECGPIKGPVFIKTLTGSVPKSELFCVPWFTCHGPPHWGKKISTDFTLQKETVEGPLEIHPPEPYRRSKRRIEVTEESPEFKWVLNFT